MMCSRLDQRSLTAPATRSLRRRSSRRSRRRNRDLDRHALRLDLVVHKRLQICDVLIGQVREAAVQLHILADRLVLLGLVLELVHALFPLVQAEHAGLDGQLGEHHRLVLVGLPPLGAGGVEVNECRTFLVQGLPDLVHEIDRVREGCGGHVVDRRVTSGDELRRVLGEELLALGDHGAGRREGGVSAVRGRG